MADLPDIHPDDRHIDPIEDDKPETILDAFPPEHEPELGEPIPNSDGSVSFDLTEDGPPVPTAFSDNLAEFFSEDALQSFAMDYMDLIEKDREGRKKRDEQYEEGLRRTGLGDDAPGGASFSGSSRVVHPILAESCIDFASRAIKELFPASGPVKTRIWGKETEEKVELAGRKAKFMNWQMTVKISEYRSELEQMLTQLPMGGSQYQKFWHDDRFRRPRTEFVPIDDVFLPYATTDFYTAQRVTHVQHITEFEYEARVTSGLYRNLGPLSDTGGFTDQSATSKANDKIEGKERDAYNEDGLRDVYEIYTWREFEEDDVSGGAMAPYIVTVDAYTEEVLAVYRNWEDGDAEMEKLDWMVEWKFIPWRGAYAIGLPHLIGGISGALTGALRALLDSAHINNSQTLLKLKGGKTSGQNIEVEPTQIAEIDAPAGIDDIRKTIMAMPYNQPSPVLFQLLDWLTNAGKGVIATATEAVNSVGDRTPVGTTMAMVEQNSHTYSAIHARLHASQTKAIQILCRINATFLDDEASIDDLGEVIVKRSEFNSSLDIAPVSDPNIFSEAQRFAQIQGIQQIKAIFPTLQWNDDALARRMLARMRVDNIEDILPEPKKPQNMNPIAENLAAMHGTNLLALPLQNHLAHLFCHLDFGTSQLFSNPSMAVRALPVLIEHCTQHIGFYYADAISQATKFEDFVEQIPTKQMEEALAHAHNEILTQVTETLAPAMEKFTQMQQMMQKLAPPPPVDQAVQATKEVAMAEIKRKTDRDSAEIGLKQKQILELEPQLNQLKIQSVEAARANTDSMKQITELLKNRDDNETNKIIEEMRLNNQALADQMERTAQSQAIGSAAPGPDMGAMTNMLLQHILSGNKEMTPQLAQGIGEQMGVQLPPPPEPVDPGPDKHAEIMAALQQMNQQRSQPKKIEFHPDGKVRGLSVDGEMTHEVIRGPDGRPVTIQ